MDWKLQPDSRQEVIHIGLGTLGFSAVMVGVFGALHAAGVYAFTWRIPLSALAGSGVATFNFLLLCLTMQNALRVREDPAQVKGIIQLSYNGRLLLQAAWCVVSYLAPCFQFVAGMLPLLFPRLVIMILQARGHYAEDGTPPPEAPEKEEEVN